MNIAMPPMPSPLQSGPAKTTDGALRLGYSGHLPVGDPGQLRLVAPAYDCATGAITFQTQGGEGTPIEYAAAGITDWTSNPNQFVDYEHRHAADAQPITLLARQLTSNGAYIYDSYVWDIRAICPVSTASARRAAAERGLRFK
jgi:hypothetical protein